MKNAGRIVAAAALVGVPAVVTEQNPKGLGTTAPELGTGTLPVFDKMTFDACRAPGFADMLPRTDIVVTGCEAHVCVLQTVVGLLDGTRRIFVVADAIGSRREENKAAALPRMERHGAASVTTEMVVVEWLATAEDPKFREVVALIKSRRGRSFETAHFRAFVLG